MVGLCCELLPFAQQLKGFPHAYGEVISLKFAKNCTLTFECVDHTGHIKVSACLSATDEGVPMDEPNQSVTLTFKTVAACIDSFVLSLLTFGTNKIQEALLETTL